MNRFFQIRKNISFLSILLLAAFVFTVFVPEMAEARDISFNKVTGDMSGGKALGSVTNVLLDMFDQAAVIILLVTTILIGYAMATGKGTVLQTVGLGLGVALLLTYGFKAVEMLSAASGSFV